MVVLNDALRGSAFFLRVVVPFFLPFLFRPGTKQILLERGQREVPDFLELLFSILFARV